MKKKILIIRSVSFQQLDRVLNLIVKEFGDSEIEVFAHAFNISRLLKYQLVKKVIPYKQKGDFSVRTIPLELKLTDYHAIIVPFSNSSGSGFLNVTRLAFKLKAKHIYTCNLHLKLVKLTKTKLNLKTGFSWINSIISTPLSLVMFLLISPFLLGKILFGSKKIKKGKKHDT